jgi:hypothetical protein
MTTAETLVPPRRTARPHVPVTVRVAASFFESKIVLIYAILVFGIIS